MQTGIEQNQRRRSGPLEAARPQRGRMASERVVGRERNHGSDPSECATSIANPPASRRPTDDCPVARAGRAVNDLRPASLARLRRVIDSPPGPGASPPWARRRGVARSQTGMRRQDARRDPMLPRRDPMLLLRPASTPRRAFDHRHLVEKRPARVGRMVNFAQINLRKPPRPIRRRAGPQNKVGEPGRLHRLGSCEGGLGPWNFECPESPDPRLYLPQDLP